MEILVNDSAGVTWKYGIDPSDRHISITRIGTGQPVPPPYIINALDGGVAHSYQIGADTTGVETITAVTYNPSYPTQLLLSDCPPTLVWSLQVTSDPRFAITPFSGSLFDLPEIIYPSSVTGLPQATTSPLFFMRPPRKVPYFVYESIRHDNRASSGVQEVIYERTDTFFEGEMEYVALGNLDIINWQDFIQSAIQGIPFDYYPSPTICPSYFVTYFMDDKQLKSDYKFPNQYTFKLRWYQYVGWVV